MTQAQGAHPTQTSISRRDFAAGSALTLGMGAALGGSQAIVRGAEAGSPAQTASGTGQAQAEGATATYTGVGAGRGGAIVAKVSLTGTTITSVDVIKHSETPFIATSALSRIPALVVANQSLDIDVVTGATYTSVGILAAVRDALAQAGIAEDQLAHSGTETGLVTEEPIDAPIAIVGGGLAGLTTLARVLQGGGRAVLFEETAHIGGSCCVSDGWVTGAGTLLERGEGIEDSPEQMYQYMMSRSEQLGATVPFPEIVEAYCMKAGEVLDWLDTYVNVDFDRTGTYGLYVPPDVPRIYGTNGGDRIVRALIETIAPSIQAGDAQIILDAKVTRILKDDAGAVSGIEVSYATGEVRELPFGAVVMCTGGYSSNSEVLEENGVFNYGTGAPSTARGHGLPVLSEAGCQMVLMQAASGYAAGLNLGSTEYLYKANNMVPGCIWVGTAGARIGNEDSYVAGMSAWSSTPDHVGYVVFDDHGRELGLRPIVHTGYLEPEVTPWEGWQMLDELVAAGEIAFASQDPAELAQRAGIDPDAFCATVEAYNGYCAAGVDPDFGRTQNLVPLEGTLYAIKTTPYQIQTCGGARISTTAQALGEDGAPIPGLFVAGEAAGFSQWSTGGHGGTGLGGAATWGYVAADAALAYVG